MAGFMKGTTEMSKHLGGNFQTLEGVKEKVELSGTGRDQVARAKGQGGERSDEPPSSSGDGIHSYSANLLICAALRSALQPVTPTQEVIGLTPSHTLPPNSTAFGIYSAVPMQHANHVTALHSPYFVRRTVKRRHMNQPIGGRDEGSRPEDCILWAISHPIAHHGIPEEPGASPWPAPHLPRDRPMEFHPQPQYQTPTSVSGHVQLK
ncbi:hypothetical protein BJ875DRAFT_542344 [Amylocarpus encephaloides]|uniref:Uncharacterized protein n=1 Tax=Amylocarpus encephaloides TaxID=45428 RepID=A0A9P8C7L8_9HELO|nr:hypothetical protein BJ875DRAFT_542344 [Amylocarpus encephaloides]